jgi:hypothetical protein
MGDTLEIQISQTNCECEQIWWVYTSICHEHDEFQVTPGTVCPICRILQEMPHLAVQINYTVDLSDLGYLLQIQ